MFDNKNCVLIVDDEPLMTSVISDFLKVKGFISFTASNGEEALEIYYNKNNKIDIILLDVMMPKMDGHEVLRELRANEDNIPVILLTAKSQEYDEIEGLKLGADDYLRKPFSINVLLARIETILNRFNKKTADIIKVSDLEFNIAKHSLLCSDESIELTIKEFELLHYLLLNKNIILSRETILNSVWGYSYDGDIRTVDTHIKQIRNKIDKSLVNIKTIYKVGYVLEEN